jgi:hypothetical protein
MEIQFPLPWAENRLLGHLINTQQEVFIEMAITDDVNYHCGPVTLLWRSRMRGGDLHDQALDPIHTRNKYRIELCKMSPMA